MYLRAELEQTIPNREDLEIVLRETLAEPALLDEALNGAVVIGRNRGVTWVHDGTSEAFTRGFKDFR